MFQDLLVGTPPPAKKIALSKLPKPGDTKSPKPSVGVSDVASPDENQVETKKSDELSPSSKAAAASNFSATPRIVLKGTKNTPKSKTSAKPLFTTPPAKSSGSKGNHFALDFFVIINYDSYLKSGPPLNHISQHSILVALSDRKMLNC